MYFEFIERKYWWFSFSGLLILIGILALLLKGVVFGIEFKGGTLFDIIFKKAKSVAALRESLKKVALEESVIQIVGEERKEALIRSPELSITTQEKVKTLMKAEGATDFSIQSVGPSWGAQLTQGTIVALVLSLGIVLVFVATRFEFKMGIAAVIALIHDLVIAAGLYALIGREVTTSTVAAFLTILGYSLYDTIVIFDRVRENTVGLKKRTYSEMINDSINQTLRRSINTSLTSIIPVASLFFIGGETLKDFAFALLVGLTSGTYSSIFIASPILALWKEREPRYQALRRRLAKA